MLEKLLGERKNKSGKNKVAQQRFLKGRSKESFLFKLDLGKQQCVVRGTSFKDRCRTQTDSDTAGSLRGCLEKTQGFLGEGQDTPLGGRQARSK